MSIKLIIWDLDGVLICSKRTHFEALNKALEDFNEKPISYTEHISQYDGKPTKEKLVLRGISKEKFDPINKKKQEYTFDILEEEINKDDKLINIFKKLKEEGYLVNVASNSIRYTIQLVLFKLGIMRYVDYIVSNEDVGYGKPRPEMYLKCMINSNVGPKETIIVEDSYVGRQGVYNSGAYLCAVNSPEDVTYELIKSTIVKYNGDKPKWRSNDMNILIPMAGAGSRFAQAGYTFPKPLIDVNGKPMIQVVVENINIEGHYIFMVRKEHYDKYDLKHMLEIVAPGCSIVIVDHLTEGAACTTLIAKDLINNDEQLLIANSDQYIEWDSSHFMYSMQNDHIDGGVLTFENTHPKWSYAKINDEGYITEIREKSVISTMATVGIYHWRRGCDYVKYAEQMIQKDIRVNGEYFVAPIYNEAIQDGRKFKIYNVNSMSGLGTPEDLNIFLNKKKD
jgi:HAD superfamily hydrolase (TIGR01509 family)